MIRNFFECFKPLNCADQLHTVGNVNISESDVVPELSDMMLKLNTVVVDVAVKNYHFILGNFNHLLNKCAPALPFAGAHFIIYFQNRAFQSHLDFYSRLLCSNAQ